ncbi:MCP four helix bundle domain-containing protein [Aeromonas hydrophila]|nr:MCP four helix bundle domain-containing protein [Aeromonas hydrophila]WAG04515.1 MCP four helix bundle domain-containing protein [Aeromonas hydrophila]
MEGISIRQKLILGCVVPLLALVLLVIGAVQAMSQLMAGMNSMYQGEVVQLKELKQIADLYAVKVIDAANKANVGGFDPARSRADMNAAQQEIKRIWQGYRSQPMSQAEQREADQMQGLFAAADREIEAVMQILADMQGSNQGQLAAHIMPLYRVIDPVSDGISALVEYQLKEAEKNMTELNGLRGSSTGCLSYCWWSAAPASCSSGCGPGAASASPWLPWAGSCAACRGISI